MKPPINILQTQGQICKIITPRPDENPEDVFILVDDPTLYDDSENVHVVNIKELQRNIKNPQSATRIAIAQKELTVISESLTDYINSWNNPIF